MFVLGACVRTHTERRAHLRIDSILIGLVELDDWLEEVAGVVIDFVELARISKLTISPYVFCAGVARCNQ